MRYCGISLGVLLSVLWAHAADAVELLVTKSYSACRDPATVRKFEEFERDNDDQGYKRLYVEVSVTKECIFLRSNEIVIGGENRDRWICVKESEGGNCYWTAKEAVRVR